MKRTRGDLMAKAQKIGVRREQTGGKTIQNTPTLSVDYVRLCYCL